MYFYHKYTILFYNWIISYPPFRQVLSTDVMIVYNTCHPYKKAINLTIRITYLKINSSTINLTLEYFIFFISLIPYANTSILF